MRFTHLRQLCGWLARLFSIFNRRRREREFAEELESHLAMHIEDNLCAGMSPEEARRLALIKLGGVTQIRELHREQRGLPMLETMLQDLRFGLRMLVKSPAFALAAILSLAIGIGANTALFSVVNAVLWRPLPYPGAERLVRVGDRIEQELFEAFKARRVFDSVAGWSERDFMLTGRGGPAHFKAQRITPELLSLLGVAPQAGRAFLAEEFEPGRDQVALISHRLWQSRFGADPLWRRPANDRASRDARSSTPLSTVREAFALLISQSRSRSCSLLSATGEKMTSPPKSCGNTHPRRFITCLRKIAAGSISARLVLAPDSAGTILRSRSGRR